MSVLAPDLYEEHFPFVQRCHAPTIVGPFGNYHAPFYSIAAIILNAINDADDRKTFPCLMQERAEYIFSRYSVITVKTQVCQNLVRQLVLGCVKEAFQIKADVLSLRKDRHTF